VVIAFQAPHSYTGEDVVEFQCHGGVVAPRRVLEACFAAGARLARRGEFTERAFLNGKLTYEQAEGVLDLVNAKTDRAADAALAGLAGARRAEMRAIYAELLALSSTVEHALDVSEEELPDGFTEKLLAGVASADVRLESAQRRLREGRILREGALVVIAGAPNAGKSSLMNALLGERRAIVSDVPGTTRDSIEEWLDVGGWPVRLVDTAGLRETDDAIEGEGVERARGLMARADVVVRLTPAGEEALKVEKLKERRLKVESWDGAETFDCRGPSVIDVLSKCDLSSNLQPSTSQPSTFNLSSPISVSSKTGEGLDALRGAIAAELARRADEGRADSAGGDFSGGDAAAVAAARAALAAPPRDLVLLADALRAAAEALGEATGAEYSADLLDSLFSRFCVGK
jgi:tRNA modification GTPase